ncbi:hypothetical protein ACIGT4_00155 [Streptomyces sioyaensis]|uniref:hypothetical protein n=1 Tax=Streptomyces sioyaensis TaxID=67364 RepID=UPI0037CCFAE9
MSASPASRVMPAPPAPVIFDLDGTLVDSEPHYYEAGRRLGADPAACVVPEDAASGALAAHRAGMRCIAVPYVAGTADDPAFAHAGLLFKGGQEEFTARAAYDWLGRGGGAGG